jgi:peptidoglycan/xylan/chitin deacetylase (PgdA/CDA1 family)
MFNIPILTYHNITNGKGFGLTSIRLTQFREQIRFLHDSGYSAITFTNLSNSSTLPQKPIIITFDDGYESVFINAMPILDEFKMRASIFVVSNFIGRLNLWESFSIQRKFKHLNKEQLTILHSHGFEIGSHSMNHPHLPSCSSFATIDEINESKYYIEKLLNSPVISFCYPYGSYNRRVVNAVEEAGYQYAVSNMRFNTNKTNHSLQRRSIYASDSIDIFKLKLNKINNFSWVSLTEWIIQRGSIPGIVKNRLL